jgi:hypothetical protein
LLVLLSAKYATAYRSGEATGSPASSNVAQPSGNLGEPGATAQTNYALQFDGSDDYARVLNIGNFDFTTTFTLEAWVKPDTVTSDGQWEAFLNGRVFDDPTGTSGGWMMYLPTSDHSRWGMFLCTTGCTSFLGPASSLVAGEWVHVAVTYDAVGAIIKIYQDGVQVADKVHTGDVAEVNYLFFGASSGTFNGVIDEIRIWNIARTAEEIRSTMIGSLQGDEAGLVGYWPLDDGDGQFATDATGNGQLWAQRIGRRIKIRPGSHLIHRSYHRSFNWFPAWPALTQILALVRLLSLVSDVVGRLVRRSRSGGMSPKSSWLHSPSTPWVALRASSCWLRALAAPNSVPTKSRPGSTPAVCSHLLSSW